MTSKTLWQTGRRFFQKFSKLNANDAWGLVPSHATLFLTTTSRRGRCDAFGRGSFFSSYGVAMYAMPCSSKTISPGSKLVAVLLAAELKLEVKPPSPLVLLVRPEN